MKVRSASVEDLYLGAQYWHDTGQLSAWRWRVVRIAYVAALWLMRWAA